MAKILAIDVGNSNIVVGCIEEGRVLFTERMETRAHRDQQMLYDMFRDMLYKHRITPAEIEGSILSSVVPDANALIMSAAWRLTGKLCLKIDRSFDSGLDLSGYDSATLGIDRITDMTAAVAKYGAPVLVCDLGTATTISVADGQKRFLGGMISAGIQLSLRALGEYTAQLPELCAAAPEKLIGADTVESIISGTVIGQAAMIDGITERVAQQLGVESISLVLTGGLSRYVIPWLKHKVSYEPELLFTGMELLYHRNQHRLAALEERT